MLAMLPASAALAIKTPTKAARAARVEATLRVARTSECTFEPPPQKMVVEVTIHTASKRRNQPSRSSELQADGAQVARRRVAGGDEAVSAHAFRLVQRRIRAA